MRETYGTPSTFKPFSDPFRMKERPPPLGSTASTAGNSRDNDIITIAPFIKSLLCVRHCAGGLYEKGIILLLEVWALESELSLNLVSIPYQLLDLGCIPFRF